MPGPKAFPPSPVPLPRGGFFSLFDGGRKIREGKLKSEQRTALMLVDGAVFEI